MLAAPATLRALEPSGAAGTAWTTVLLLAIVSLAAWLRTATVKEAEPVDKLASDRSLGAPGSACRLDRMFRWVKITGGLDGPPTSLQLSGYEVARLEQRVDGVWLASLGRNLPFEQQVTRVCSSFETGQRGCELWAERHIAELRAWASEREAARLARTPWRPRST